MDGRSAALEILEDDAGASPPAGRVETATHAALSGIQDVIIESIHDPWPSRSGAGGVGRDLPQPDCRVRGRELLAWFGDEAAPAPGATGDPPLRPTAASAQSSAVVPGPRAVFPIPPASSPWTWDTGRDEFRSLRLGPPWFPRFREVRSANCRLGFGRAATACDPGVRAFAAGGRILPGSGGSRLRVLVDASVVSDHCA